MTSTEVRLERLRPAQVRDALERAAIAWLPMGAIEFHAEHLPLGTDGFAAHAVVERAARLAGGVVLPWSALTIGTLHLPWSLRYDRALVEAALRSTLEQLAAHGARVIVVHTGHAPLDLIHLIKRVCASFEAEAPGGPDLRAYGVCYLELNAALGAGLGTDWPVAVDHASITETSWMMALEPDLVALETLPDGEPPGGIVGIYGPNPRARASVELGERQWAGCASLLAQRATALLGGERVDPYADLRGFVARYWPEPMDVGAGVAGAQGAPGSRQTLLLRHPGPVSRYLTHLELRVDGKPIDRADLTLVNPTVGEAGVPVAVSSLGPESGFYIRRGQVAELRLAGTWPVGRHHVELTLGLAGVASSSLTADVEVA